jgi:hypothetical protein
VLRSIVSLRIDDSRDGGSMDSNTYEEIYGRLNLTQINAVCVAYKDGSDKVKKELGEAFPWLLKRIEDE